MMKIGVIAELLGKPLLESIAEAAQIGAQGIQLYGGHHGIGFDFSALKDDEIKQIREACAKHQLELSAVCGDVCSKSFQVPSECQERVDFTRKVLDNMAKLGGVKVMTTHIGCVPESPSDPVYDTMVKSVGDAARHAESLGLKFAIETGPEMADVLKRFIKDVNCPALGVNLDPANLRGVSGEDPVYAVEVLHDYIYHTHAKDSIQVHPGSSAAFYGMRNPDGSVREISARAAGYKEVPLGQGMVPWEGYLKALQDHNYNGFLTIERECGENPAKDIKLAIAFLRYQLQKLA